MNDHARSRPDSGVTVAPDPVSPAPDRPSLPCVYCRQDIPAGSFRYWSDRQQLLSATCPSCNDHGRC